jgi:hypothetical protein
MANETMNLKTLIEKTPDATRGFAMVYYRSPERRSGKSEEHYNEEIRRDIYGAHRRNG